eukprot:14649598-Alexandrium_andersonii.AAC.1
MYEPVRQLNSRSPGLLPHECMPEGSALFCPGERFLPEARQLPMLLPPAGRVARRERCFRGPGVQEHR